MPTLCNSARFERTWWREQRELKVNALRETEGETQNDGDANAIMIMASSSLATASSDEPPIRQIRQQFCTYANQEADDNP